MRAAVGSAPEESRSRADAKIRRPARGPLLERDAALSAFAEGIAAARDGRGSVVVVRAAAGLGKTRLLGAAAQLGCDADLMILRASAAKARHRRFASTEPLRLRRTAAGRAARLNARTITLRVVTVFTPDHGGTPIRKTATVRVRSK